MTELMDKYREHYLVNIEDINFTNIQQLCHDLNIKYNNMKPQSTMNNVVRSLSDKYTDSLVILLCDEIFCYESPDWSNMETCHNVIWLMAINPMSNVVGNMEIVTPTSDDVLSQQYNNNVTVLYHEMDSKVMDMCHKRGYKYIKRLYMTGAEDQVVRKAFKKKKLHIL